MTRTRKGGMTCSNCSASLPLPPDGGVVVCEYCGTQNAVPGTVDEGPIPVGAPVPAQPRSGSRAVIVLVPLLLVLAGAAVSLFVTLSRGVPGPGKGVLGDAEGLVDASAVVPSWEAVDGLATARNVVAAVEGRWRPGARASAVRWLRVRADGTQDLGNDEEASIILEFHDTARFEGILPGESTVKGSRLGVSILGAHVYGNVSDTSVGTIGGLVMIEEMPRCDLATLRRKAAEAGYPDAGYMDVTFPQIPHDLTADGMAFRLAFVRPDGDELAARLEKDGWDPSPYRFYGVYVNNLDATGLPGYFSPVDCAPVDVDGLVEERIEALRR